MKKVLAVLLAILMTFSFVTVIASAEEEETTGKTYTAEDFMLEGKVANSIKTAPGEVLILQPGDKVDLGTMTKGVKKVTVTYWCDAAYGTFTGYNYYLKTADVKNTNWKEEVTAQYNLDTSKWTLDAEKGETANMFMAKSPNFYKSFVEKKEFAKNDELTFEVLGFGDLAIGRDSTNAERAENVPIDFALEGAEFVGWALYDSTYLKATETASTTAREYRLYALWNRDAASDEPGTEDPIEESDDPIVNAMNKVLGWIATASGWVRAVPALLNAGLAMILNTGVKNWLYKIFGIEA